MPQRASGRVSTIKQILLPCTSSSRSWFSETMQSRFPFRMTKICSNSRLEGSMPHSRLQRQMNALTNISQHFIFLLELQPCVLPHLHCSLPSIAATSSCSCACWWPHPSCMSSHLTSCTWDALNSPPYPCFIASDIPVVCNSSCWSELFYYKRKKLLGMYYYFFVVVGWSVWGLFLCFLQQLRNLST